MVTSNGKGAVDVDEDWFSESEDFLDDPKYTSAGLGAGGYEFFFVVACCCCCCCCLLYLLLFLFLFLTQ